MITLKLTIVNTAVTKCCLQKCSLLISLYFFLSDQKKHSLDSLPPFLSPLFIKYELHFPRRGGGSEVQPLDPFDSKANPSVYLQMKNGAPFTLLLMVSLFDIIYGI